MKKLSLFLCVCTLLVLTGCGHTSQLQWTAPAPGQTSSSGNPVVYNLYGVNNGVFLFYFIPLWSGDPRYPNRFDYDTFSNFIRERDADKLLRSRLRQMKADDVEDIECRFHSTGAWSLWILWKRTLTASGVAVRNKRK